MVVNHLELDMLKVEDRWTALSLSLVNHQFRSIYSPQLSRSLALRTEAARRQYRSNPGAERWSQITVNESSFKPGLFNTVASVLVGCPLTEGPMKEVGSILLSDHVSYNVVKERRTLILEDDDNDLWGYEFCDLTPAVWVIVPRRSHT